MDENAKFINEFVNKYNNTLVLDYTNVRVLRGWYDGEDDYYWVLQDLKGNTIQSSCVCEIIALKGYIPEDSYNRLKNMFQCNLDLLNKKIE